MDETGRRLIPDRQGQEHSQPAIPAVCDEKLLGSPLPASSSEAARRTIERLRVEVILDLRLVVPEIVGMGVARFVAIRVPGPNRPALCPRAYMSPSERVCLDSGTERNFDN